MWTGKDDCMCSTRQKPKILFHNNRIFLLDGAGMKQPSSSSQGALPGCGEVGFQSFC